MNSRTIITEALTFLFEEYLSTGGTGLFSLNGIAQRHNIDPTVLGSSLDKAGWIKNPNYGPFGFYCQISRSGIAQIRPDYFQNLISQALITAGQTRDWTGLLETLAFPSSNYQIVHDLGKIFEEQQLAEVQYLPDDVYIKLNTRGLEQYHHENEGGFI